MPTSPRADAAVAGSRATGPHSDDADLATLVRVGCRRALNEQDRDPYSATYGCFDRRYWGWKLVDFPEATFQRLVYPLVWLLDSAVCAGDANAADSISDAIIAGLLFAARIQHADGSFDQAFPHERSYGATAFLVHPLLAAYEAVRERCTAEQRRTIETMAFRGATFLSRHHEAHGRITNHLAGGVLSLFTAARALRHERFAEAGQALLSDILATQSPEGWFPEYDGADPGYQTLCVYYLASVAAVASSQELTSALHRAVDFLAWFAHPDGSFGGEYGSRRTGLYYPGGIALLARELPTARALMQAMTRAIAGGRTTTVADVDVGNLAPLLSNYVAAVRVARDGSPEQDGRLPWEAQDASCDFPQAGLYVRARGPFYAIVGAGTGGATRIFDRRTGCLAFEDAGYVGSLEGVGLVTSQASGMLIGVRATSGEVEVKSRFVRLGASIPTPGRFMLLRLLNLTLMRSIRVGNWMKRALVRMLIQPGRSLPVTLSRRVSMGDDQVVVQDEVEAQRGLRFHWLEGGRSFVSIHMASARYLDGERALSRPRSTRRVDVDALSTTGRWNVVTHVR